MEYPEMKEKITEIKAYLNDKELINKISQQRIYTVKCGKTK